MAAHGFTPTLRLALRGGIASCVVTSAAAPAVRVALLHGGVMDVPNHRSSHTAPIPRGGGIACLVGVTAGWAFLESSDRLVRRRVPVALAVTPLALAALGAADDFTGGLPPLPRLAAQVAAGGAMASADLPAAAWPMILVGVPGIVNVVNFMDGINGITGSTAAVWGLNALSLGHSRNDITLMGLAALTAGSGLGFLPWNAPTAKLFLGDAGSYLFGALMATGVAAATRSPFGLERTPRWTQAYQAAAPLVLYGVDAAQAIARRRAQGADLTEAHREHVYQRLVDAGGLSHTTVSALHASAAATVAVASRLPRRFGIPLTAAAVGAYLALPRLFPRQRGAEPATVPEPAATPDLTETA